MALTLPLYIYIDLKLHIARLRAYARSFYIKTVDSQKVEEFNDRNGTSFEAGYKYIHYMCMCVCLTALMMILVNYLKLTLSPR